MNTLILSSASIGIIGGADGPTAIFVSGSPIPLIAAGVIVLAVAALIVFKKRKK